MRIVINTMAARDLVRRAKGTALSAAAVTLRNYIRSKINIDGPPRSKPGEYPRRDTKMLWKTFKVTVDISGDFADVGSNMPYARHLERIRPYLLRGLTEAKTKIQIAVGKARVK